MNFNDNFDLRKHRDFLLAENFDTSNLQEEELEEEVSLEEMAKLTSAGGELTPLGQKAADIIKNNPELKKSALLKALNADPEIAQILDANEEELHQNQTNRFAEFILGNRELGQRGAPKKSVAEPAAEPKVKTKKSPTLKITNPKANEKPVSSLFGDGSIDPEEIEMAKQAAKAAKSSKEFADEVAPDKTERFNKGLKFVTKHKDDRDLVDAYLKKAKDEYKLSANMIKDLKRAAGRQVEV